MSKIYKLERSQLISKKIEDVWDFFSNVKNLQEITPPQLDFKIISDIPKRIYAGTIIEYRIKTAFSIPMNWVSEITQVNEPYFFIDEQRFGPYSFWHHQHHFERCNEGTIVRDIVHYKVPLGFLGRLIHRFYISGELRKIFEYRQKKLEEIFI